MESTKEPVTIAKYRHTRHWAVFVGEELLAVTVYRRGAESVEEYLRAVMDHGRKPVETGR